jgi:hypothetical protein
MAPTRILPSRGFFFRYCHPDIAENRRVANFPEHGLNEAPHPKFDRFGQQRVSQDLQYIFRREVGREVPLLVEM